ncbi:MAG TPA: L,D-transpeptidase family protein [Candidatus Angelobacter sp.]|nr:L,D-transpeptidase family protein [Candidatus Angelobacter sp.]
MRLIRVLGRSVLKLLQTYFVFSGAIVSLAVAVGPDQADHILIVKSKRTMTLMRGAKVLKAYSVALGTVPTGAKEKQGDHKTPEGNYVIDAKNSYSRFHLALHISYPKAEDRERAKRMGVNPGGDIMIHGLESRFAFLGALHRQTDWTDGCVAVTNSEIEEIWKLVPVGTTVEIRP